MTKALVLFSGGQDSTTCLCWALQKFDEVEALSIYYGQRHKIEISCAREICRDLKVTHNEIATDIFRQIGDSALVGTSPISDTHRAGAGLPASFVPGRNILFLTIAGAVAFKRGFNHLVTGTCQTDYSGYPDCREEFIKHMDRALNAGLGYQIDIHTPLMYLSKAESIKLASTLPRCLEMLALSHTCYEGKRPPCGVCPACLLREKGFREAGVVDPLIRMFTTRE